MGKPAARKTDITTHGLPLDPGPGSLNVFIGGLPAWRAIPAAAAAALQAGQQAGDTAVKAAASARTAAAGTPGYPAAQAAELAAQAAATAAFSSAMAGAIGAGTAMAAASGSAGMPDTHVCKIPLAPTPTPHGPGVVIDGSKSVFINGLPASRQGDTVLEALGGPDKIALGLPTVLIGDESGGGGGSGSGASGASAGSTAHLNAEAQASTLKEASKNGVPFCEECAK